MKYTVTLVTALLMAPLAALHAADAPADPTPARPPVWAAKGAYVFRVSTPDEADVLPQLEQGHEIVANLLDGTVPQITIVNGLIGHDHPGAWNWDGLWPYWNRATFRAGSFEKLAEFMTRAKKNSNVHTGFHLNLTDVNIGLRDYPESRAFFQKLVETKSIYRRDWNKATNRRDGDPFVPREIEIYAASQDNPDPVQIFALVNYKRFWDSGLAKQMIDEFYGHLPFAPPMLYLDVLNAKGGNFSTGAPDGPLGGSEETQVEGMQAIADYLRSKGTDLGTEGPRTFLGTNAEGRPRAGYVWLHGPGLSTDDYSEIRGAIRWLYPQHTYGNPGGFNLSPVSLGPEKIAENKAHYAALLDGKPGIKPVAGINTFHIAYRNNNKDEYSIPGTGDPFRGDWVDLVNNFYMATIQELYHIGNHSVRERQDGIGTIHLGNCILRGPNGSRLEVSPAESIGRKNAKMLMIEAPVESRVTASTAGSYTMSVPFINNAKHSKINIYINGRLFRAIEGHEFVESPIEIENLELKTGENIIAFDAGAARATWSDGTIAEWTTPYLRKGFRAWNGDVTFAEDYNRMWPDTWSGQQKIYFFSWDGTGRPWKLPADWNDVPRATLYPLTPEGRGKGLPIAINDRTITPSLLPQVPYILIPETK